MFKNQTYIQEEPKFVVDSSLCRLARMMRNLAFDTAHQEDYKYSQIVDIAEHENRLIITRNKIFKNNSKMRWIHLQESKVENQMNELIKFLNLKIKNSTLMSRCVKCNNGVLTVKAFKEVETALKENGLSLIHI